MMKKFLLSAALLGLFGGQTASADFPTSLQVIDFPGSGVAISGEWAVVGDALVNCAAAVFRFDYETGLWGDGAGTPGAAFQILDEGGGCSAQPVKGFGSSISIADELLIIGAPQAKISDGGAKDIGAIYFYTFDGTSWVLESFSEEPTAQAGAEFGTSVSLRRVPATDEYLILIGAPFYNAGANLDNAGRVYLIGWNNSTKTSVQLAEFDGENADDNFGFSVTSNGVYAVIGAPNYDSTGYTDDGAIYIFNEATPNAGPVDLITTPDLSEQLNLMQLGTEVSLVGDFLMGSGINSYMFQKTGTLGDPQFTQVHKVLNTNGADVSQSGGLQAYGNLGSGVLIYEEPAADPADFSIPGEGEADYAIDISLSDNRLMVNGENATPSPATYAYTFPCGLKPDTLQNRVWKMVSVPCGGSMLVEDVFADMGTLDVNYAVVEQGRTEWSGATASNRRLAAGETVSQDRSYWVYAIAPGGQTEVNWQVNSTANPALTPIDTSLADASTAGYYVVPNLPAGDAPVILRPGDPVSVMLANPFPKPFDLSEVQVEVDGATEFLGSAAAATWYKNSTVYVYDLGSTIPSGQNYRAVVANGTPGVDDKIQPYEGFWIQLTSDALTPAIALPLAK